MNIKAVNIIHQHTPFSKAAEEENLPIFPQLRSVLIPGPWRFALCLGLVPDLINGVENEQFAIRLTAHLDATVDKRLLAGNTHRSVT